MDALQHLPIRPLLPELFLCIATLMLLMAGTFRGNRSTPVLAVGALLALLLTLYMVIIGTGPRAVFMDMFVSDAFTAFGKIIVLVGGIIALVLAFNWLKDEENRRFEYPILILFALLGMLLMISAMDLLSLYMGLELSSLALYVLAAFRRDDVRSSEAGLKYFVLGALASGMMLFGISLIYGFTGTTSFALLAKAIGAMQAGSPALHAYGLVTGMVLLLIGFCFKVSAAPFHMWTPDVYQGAPTPVTAFFAMAPKAAAFFLLIRVLEQPFADLKPYWQQIIMFVAMLSMIAGALGALKQTNIKRLLAYSSIGHAGYALVGVAAGGADGAQAVLIYLAIYLAMTAGAFGCVLVMRRHGEYVEALDDLAGISKSHPQLALALALLMFSMAGIPPLAGFFGKMYVFLAALQHGLFVLAVVGVLTSVIACYYYLNIVKIMYFEEGKESFDAPLDRRLRLVVTAAVLAVALFVFYPAALVDWAAAAVKALPL